MRALKLVLEDYERTSSSTSQQIADNPDNNSGSSMTAEQQGSARRIAAHIKQLSDDIWQTLQAVVNAVSR
jgi:hypothetical protein